MIGVFDSWSGTDLNLLIAGSVNGLVLNGVPQIIRADTLEPPVSASWGGAVLTLTYANPLLDGLFLTMDQQSLAFRNGFGGFLAPFYLNLPPAVVPVVNTDLVSGYVDGIQAALVVSGGGGTLFCQGGLGVTNSTNAEAALTARIDGNIIFATFPTAPISSDSINVSGGAANWLNQSGGYLIGGDIVLA